MSTQFKFVTFIAAIILISLFWYSIVIFKISTNRDSTDNTNLIKGTYRIVVNEEHILENKDNPLRVFVIQFTITNRSNEGFKLPVPDQLLIKYQDEMHEFPLTKKYLQAANIADEQIIASGDKLQFALPFHGTGLPKNLAQLDNSTLEWLDSKNKTALILKYQP